MKEYFQRKVGEKMVRTVVRTKNPKPFECGTRRFTAEVLWVDDVNVGVSLRSVDMTPSGFDQGGTHCWLGDAEVRHVAVYGLEEFWRRVLAAFDKAREWVAWLGNQPTL